MFFVMPVGNNIEKRDIPYVTFGLIGANVLVFLHQLSLVINAGSSEAALQADLDFYSLFGLIPNDLAELKVLGLITYMFVHGGLFHLVGNMVMLYVFGPAIEYGLGRWTMLGFYGFFGLLGGVAHAMVDLGSTIPLVGASGAIAGLIGAYTVTYGPGSKIRMMAIIMFRPVFFNVPAFLFGIGWILMQVVHASNDPGGGGGVAWWCHIGGFLPGAAMAWICRNELEVELVAGDGDTLRMVSAEEIADQQAKEERKALGLSTILIPLQDDELGPPPTVCEHCDETLEEKDQIGAQLFRCSNCQRMVYLSVQQAEALSAAQTC